MSCYCPWLHQKHQASQHHEHQLHSIFSISCPTLHHKPRSASIMSISCPSFHHKPRASEHHEHVGCTKIRKPASAAARSTTGPQAPTQRASSASAAPNSTTSPRPARLAAPRFTFHKSPRPVSIISISCPTFHQKPLASEHHEHQLPHASPQAPSQS